MTEAAGNDGLVVAVVVADGVTASDAVNPAEALSMVPGATVRFVGPEKGPKRTFPGPFALVADATFDEVPHPDVVVVPADLSSVTDQRTLAWLRQAHETSRWTTSVCAGALTLGAAGLLTGKRATTHWLVKDVLQAMGATYVAERWVRDGKIITAAGNSAGIDMVLFLIGELAGPAVAKAVQLGMEYDPQPPFNSGSLTTADADTVGTATRLLHAALRDAGAPPGMLALVASQATSAP
jgi:transcriptional regulator GlxA family with amidase domain